MVLDVAAVAERLDVDVDDVGAGRGQRPDEVLAATDQDVAREGRGGGAARRPARPVQVHLERQARIEVADLGPADEQRVARARALAGHHQDVARLAAHLLLAVRRGRLRRGRGQRRRLERAVVEHDVARAVGGQRCVGEVAGDRDGRLRVLALAQVVPHGEAALRAELVAQAVEHLRGGDLVAATLAEQLALDGVQGDHVEARPGLVGPVVGLVVGVDALHVDVDVVQQAAGRAPVAAQLADLLRHLALGLRARLELLQSHDQVDRRQARDVDDRHPGVPARLLEQQLAVVGERPARAPGHVISSSSRRCAGRCAGRG